MQEDGETLELRAGDSARTPVRRLRLTLAASALVHVLALSVLGTAGMLQAPQRASGELRLLIEHSATGDSAEPPVEAMAAELPHEHQALVPTAAAALPAAQSAAPVAAAGTLPESLEPASSAQHGELAIVARPVHWPAPVLEAEPAPAAARALSTVELERMLERVQRWIHDLDASDPRREQLTWQQDGVPYSAVLRRRVAASATDFDRFEVEIETPAEGGSWRTGLSLQRVAFSRYSQFVDRWDPEIQLHDDVISGRFHANSTIVIGYDRSASPRFHGKVTTAGRGFRVADGFGRLRREAVFSGGLETGVEPIALPAEWQPLLAAQRIDPARIRTFERDVRIRLLADGGHEWCELRGAGTCRLEPGRGVAYLIGGPGVELRLSGVVRGQLLVHAAGRIVVEGNLRYARDPREMPESDDLLGLVAAGDVVIAPPRVTGAGDLEIHGAIYARRRFVVTAENARPARTLRIFGSLTAGTLSATEPRYATRIDHDPRLETLRPPGFPMTARYELETFSGEWRLDEELRAN